MTGPCILESSHNGLRFLLYNTICHFQSVRPISNWEEVNRALLQTAAQVNELLTIYDSGSELAQLNLYAGMTGSVSVSPRLCELLCRVWQAAKQSGGIFDPTIAPLMRIWDFKRMPPRVPARAAISEALKHTGYSAVHISSANRQITFSKSGMGIDPGAWGKGYALEACASCLEKYGIKEGILNFGGNLYLLGNNPRSTDGKWTVEVQKPWSSRGETIGKLSLPSCAVSTSAAYDNFYDSEGVVYHHLLDPRNGYPATTLCASATVVCPSPLYSDILSTVFFIGGEDAGRKCMENLSMSPQSGYLLIGIDGRITVSQNLTHLFQNTQVKEVF